MFLKSGPVLTRHIDSVFYTLSGLEDLQMTRLTASSLRNPCPVCGRTKDGDCRILNTGSVFCQTYADENIGTELEGYKFAKRNNDGRTGTWVPMDQWGDGTKAESFYSKRKEWVYHNRASIKAVAYVRDGIKKFQASKLPDSSVSDLIGDLLPYRYPELADVKSVFVAEGEKCADRLWELGQPATTFNGGANGFKPKRDAGHFDPDVTLILVPDRDQAGIAYMQQIAAAYPDNPKLWLRVWPEQPQYWNGKCPENHGLDIADWLAGKDSETARQMIADAISDEPIEVPSSIDVKADILKTEVAHQKLKEFALEIQTRDSELRPTLMYERAKQLGTTLSRSQCQKYLKAADRLHRGVRPSFKISPRSLKSSPQKYLLEGIIPLHQQTLLVAREKLGKTTFLLQLVAMQAKGLHTFLGKKISHRPLKVYIVGTDQPEHNWQEIMKRVGLDPSRIGCEGNPIRYLATMEEEVVLTPDAIIKLRDMIRNDLADGDEVLLMIDSLDACIRAIGYEERDAAISDPLRQLVSAFEGMPVTQMILHHEKKDAQPGVDAFRALRGHSSIGSTVSGGIRLEAVNPEQQGSAISMKVKNRSCAEHQLLLERSSDGSFFCIGDGTDVLLAGAMQSKQDALQENQKDVLAFIRQATIYGEPATAAELAKTDLIASSLEARARTDRARQIMQSLEDRSLVRQTTKSSIVGRPSNAWLAVEIPGVWTLDTEDPNDVSTMSTLSLTSNASIIDNSDIVDICSGSTKPTHDRLHLSASDSGFY